ncbi:MAG: methyltransferase domain-containing protein [Bacteroidales bacterium]
MQLLRKVYYHLRPGQRRVARRLFYFPVDVMDNLLNKRPPLVPAKGNIFIGQGDYIQMGDAILKNLVDTCELQPHQRILDVGCGIGRLARPLAGYLNQDGSYVGFDIVKEGINWCRKKYHHYPNFVFDYYPLQNDLYNLSTDEQAASFRFPYANNDFDLVVLTSVFTHMQAAEVNNYLQEISRVLKPGGRCFVTFFLITDESEAYINQPGNSAFPYCYGDYYLHNPRVTNANIAYRYSAVMEMIEHAGLSVEAFHEGWWAGRPEEACMNYQDVLVLLRPLGE